MPLRVPVPGLSVWWVRRTLPMVGKRSTDAIFSIIIFGVASAFTEVNLITMPRGVLKENLPTKICIVCDRPFTIYADDPAKFGDDSLTLLGSVMGMRIATVDANSNPEETNAEGERGCNIKYQPEGSNGDEEETEVEENVDDDEKSQSCSISIDHDSTSPTPPLEHFDAKAQRKAEKKRKKAERRAQKMGQGDPTAGQKRYTLCDNSVNLLIRCTYDSSGEWGMVCGKCWKNVSGGVVDGDDAHPHYRYGGLWKNRRAQQQIT